jgi:hypothetical protein
VPRDRNLHREPLRVWNAVDRRDELLAICIASEAGYVDKRLHHSARMRYSSLPAVRENPHSLLSLAGVALAYIAADGFRPTPAPTSELTRSGPRDPNATR